MDVFPNAKVVMTVRDNPEKWYDSVNNSIIRNIKTHKGAVSIFLWMIGKYRMAKIISGASFYLKPKGSLEKGKMLIVSKFIICYCSVARFIYFLVQTNI